MEGHQLLSDEHADENGLPICNVCGEKRYIINPLNNRLCYCLCSCQKEALNKKEEDLKKRQQDVKIEQLKLTSLLGKRYKNVTFENTEVDEENLGIYSRVKRYAEKYDEMLKNGYGFYVYGKNGVGKTHLLACLCNYLTERFQTCAFTNFLNIAEEIRQSYSDDHFESDVITKYSKVSFLFIDDFGKESYKKLKSDTNNLWLEEKIFEILNNRYNNMLPTIFSSNYSLKEMVQAFGFDKAIIDRIFELSTQIFEMKGRNRRYDLSSRGCW